MDETLGNVSYEDDQSSFMGLPGQSRIGERYSEDTAHKIDVAVRVITQKAFERARSILRERRDVLDRAATLLFEHEHLDRDQLQVFANRMLERSSGGDAVAA